MIEIGFSSSFKRAYKKKIKGHKELEAKFWQKVDIFMKGHVPKIVEVRSDSSVNLITPKNKRKEESL
ncbi:MAG: hypothetical protein D6778_05360 [Nitrospirae bacterium]|nr:MAG: hypothetical protein D6778_05360 [Nitrospirota bacterium]